MNTKSSLYVASVAVMILAARYGEAFVSPSPPINSKFSKTYNSAPLFGGMERIEFKIYPDGRVEETVVGVKGKNCLQITEEINNKLGNVITSQPTEEMFEQEITLEQELTLENGKEGDSGYQSSW